MKSFLNRAAAGVIAAMGIFGSVQEVSAASSTIEITGTVSVICKVNELAQQTVSGTEVNLGNITEFCNNPAGYQLWVDYTPGITGETLYIDGRAVPLSVSGSTMIDSSATASVQSHNLSISGPTTPASLSMRMVPL